jgi:hypothetical protein
MSDFLPGASNEDLGDSKDPLTVRSKPIADLFPESKHEEHWCDLLWFILLFVANTHFCFSPFILDLPQQLYSYVELNASDVPVCCAVRHLTT